MSIFGPLPHSWVYGAHEFEHEIASHVAGLNARLAVPFVAEDFIERIGADKRTYELTFSELFSAFKDVVKGHTELSHAIPEGENVLSLETARKRKVAIETGRVDLNKISVDDLLKQYEKNAPAKPSVKVNTATLEQAAHSNIATKRTTTNAWEHSSTSQKVNAGMWGAGALLSAYSTLSAAKYSVSRDDQNKMHVQWSQVGVCLLQAAMAAGCAFMAVQAVNGRSSA